MRYVGKYPSDAKIYIDYGKKKISVNYPIRQSKFKHIWKACFDAWTHIITLLIFCFIGILVLIEIIALPFALINGFEFKTEVKEITTPSFSSIILGIWVEVIAILGFIFIPPLISTGLYYLFPDYFSVKIPLFNSWCERIFTRPYEMKIKKLKTKEIQIPVFMNNTLEYKATKDFSKYLESIRIEPIKMYKRKLFNKKKRKLQILDWFAIFKFNKIPLNGYINIEFL